MFRPAGANTGSGEPKQHPVNLACRRAHVNTTRFRASCGIKTLFSQLGKFRLRPRFTFVRPPSCVARTNFVRGSPAAIICYIIPIHAVECVSLEMLNSRSGTTINLSPRRLATTATVSAEDHGRHRRLVEPRDLRVRFRSPGVLSGPKKYFPINLQ